MKRWLWLLLLLVPSIGHAQTVDLTQSNGYLQFVVVTHTTSTGACQDATTPPTYRIYEEETATPLTTGSMALLDSANTCGLYSKRVQLTTALGFEPGKIYVLYIEGTVGSVTDGISRLFQVDPFVIERGVVAAAASGSITLASTASSVSGFYSRAGTLVYIVNGVGAGQFRKIIAYNGSTKVATIDSAWITTPNTSSEYILVPR